jgi:hypothetical protein
MENQLQRIFIGLPDELKEKVFRVGRQYRTSHLSHEEGGADIVVDRINQIPLLYDWVKFTSSYILTILRNEAMKEVDIDKLLAEAGDRFVIKSSMGISIEEAEEILKTKFSAIWARNFTKENFNNVPFELVWDKETSKEGIFQAVDTYAWKQL